MYGFYFHVILGAKIIYLSKKLAMARVAGISTQRDGRGEITHVTFDIKKHKETIMPVLKQLGVVEKTQFEIDCESAITLEEARALLHKKIDEQWAE
jgi:hypothetical protein